MESLPCIIGLAILIGGAFLAFYISDRKVQRQQAALSEASNNYQKTLVILKANPNDPDAKRQALEYGRYYSNLTRENKGTTIFDEMALSNDISAATAAAGVVQQQPVVAAPPAPSLKDRLARLDQLRSEGVITDIEYADRRQKLIEEL